MKQPLLLAVLALILSGTSPIAVRAQETTSPSSQPKADGAMPITTAYSAPGETPTGKHAEGKVTMSGIGLTKCTLVLPEKEKFSLKEALQRANYSPSSNPASRPQFMIYRDRQSQVINFPALADGQPDILLQDGDSIYASMEILDHMTILGHVKTGDNFYFGKEEHPTLAQFIQLAGGMTSESKDDAVTIIHVDFFRDANDKPIMRSSVGDRFDVSLDPADLRWQQTIEKNDWVLIYPKSMKPNQVWPLLDSQNAQ